MHQNAKSTSFGGFNSMVQNGGTSQLFSATSKPGLNSNTPLKIAAFGERNEEIVSKIYQVIKKELSSSSEKNSPSLEQHMLAKKGNVNNHHQGLFCPSPISQRASNSKRKVCQFYSLGSASKEASSKSPYESHI